MFVSVLVFAGEGENLTESLGVSLSLGTSVGMDSGNIVNLLSSCYLDIFSYPPTFLAIQASLIHHSEI